MEKSGGLFGVQGLKVRGLEIPSCLRYSSTSVVLLLRASYLEARDQLGQMRSFRSERMAGICRVGNHRGVLLCHLVHLVDGAVDFAHARRLFLGRLRNIGDQARNPGNFADDRFKRPSGFADEAHALADLIARG